MLVSTVSCSVVHCVDVVHPVDETGGGQNAFREELTMDPAVGRAVDGDDVSPIGAL